MKRCGLVQDLLPLYAEEMCSEESRTLVAEHLAECAECRGMLEKMGKKLTVRMDDDVAMMKRIRRRLLIEKIAVTAVVTLAALVLVAGLGFWARNTTVEMAYDRYHLDECVWVEEDADGDLWLCKRDAATTAAHVFPTTRDSNGNYMGYDEGFDRELRDGYGFTLEQRRIDALTLIDIHSASEERTLLFQKDEKPAIQEIFYYERATGTEHTLWERS